MRYLKFSFALWLLLQGAYVSAFNAEECLQSNYNLTVTHKIYLWGILEKILTISKNKCEIEIETNSWFVFSTKWLIDVCRGPIHIKMGDRGIEVLRKGDPCQTGEQIDKFCLRLQQLDQLLQNDGLIFASGEKTDLSAPHGQVYCSYYLIKSYLERDLVFGPQISENSSRPDFSPSAKEGDQYNLFERVDQKSEATLPAAVGQDAK